jgi:hypothetical protein
MLKCTSLVIQSLAVLCSRLLGAKVVHLNSSSEVICAPLMTSFTFQDQSSSDDAHVYDFHVVYSHSYRVPVLYFQGHHSSMQFNRNNEYLHLLVYLTAYLTSVTCD